jgi:glucose/arabinose dehydrogenase
MGKLTALRVAAGLLPLLPGLAAGQDMRSDPPVRSGPAAYDDWRADAPGVLRRFDADALPEPHATASNSNWARVVPRPAGAAPRVPPGFAAMPWAGGLAMPRVIRRAPNGDIFLAESGAGRVLAFRAPPGTRKAGAATVFAAGLSQPFGIAFWPPSAPRFVYVAETARVLRYPYANGDLQALGPAEPVLTGLPEGGHWTRDLAVSPDGTRLFISVGSASNVAADMPPTPPGGIAAWEDVHGPGAAWGEEANRAVVLQFAPEDGTPRPFATGLRNCSGLAVQPSTGALWCAVNERDGLGDDLPPDYATALREGGFHGWPWFYTGAHEDPRLAGLRPDLAGRALVPDVLLQPHSAPLGLAFYDIGAGPAAFPAAYRGDAFVALHGSWNRDRRTGYKVVRLRLHDDPRLRGTVEDFATGFVVSDREVWGRPVGVAVAADGALLVSDDAGGTVWRIAPAR